MDEYIKIIKECKKLIKENREIDNSSNKLLLLYLCEAYINIGKEYKLNKSETKKIKSYRNNYAHLNKSSEIENEYSDNERRFKEMYETTINNELDPEIIIGERKKEKTKYIIMDEDIQKFIDSNKEIKDLLNEFIICKLTGSPDNASFIDEKNYLILIGDDYSSIDKIKQLIFDEYESSVNIRTLRVLGDKESITEVFQKEIDNNENNLKWN